MPTRRSLNCRRTSKVLPARNEIDRTKSSHIISLAKPPAQRECCTVAGRQEGQQSSLGVLWWPRHLGHPHLAEADIRLRSRHLYRRSRPGESLYLLPSSSAVLPLQQPCSSQLEHSSCSFKCQHAGQVQLQGEELEPARKRAEEFGVKEIYIDDLREEFVRDYVFPMFR